MKLNRKSGAAIAGAAAVLVLAATAPLTPAAAADVQCFGLNSCKGQGQCKTSANSCKGQNSCKGKGFIMMDKSTCLSKGGTLSLG